MAGTSGLYQLHSPLYNGSARGCPLATASAPAISRLKSEPGGQVRSAVARTPCRAAVTQASPTTIEARTPTATLRRTSRHPRQREVSSMSFVTHLECGNCGRFHDPTRIHNLCTGCERPLLVRYDLTSVKRAVARADLARRPADLWRYREMLPIDEPGAVISLGESMTPL